MAAPTRMMATPSSRVELRISCRKLIDKDLASKSDPCAVLYMKSGSKYIQMARTERIMNQLNPDFAKCFELDYYFEEVQNIKIAVFDIDNDTPELDDDDFLGQVECTLGNVVSASPYKKPLLSKSGSPLGSSTIVITAEETEGLNDLFHVTFRAENLDKKDFLGKSDPYLEFSRETADGSLVVVHRTEVIKNNLNPVWKTFTLKAQRLCAGDLNRQVKVSCYDFDPGTDPDLIGFCVTSVAQLKEGQNVTL